MTHRQIDYEEALERGEEHLVTPIPSHGSSDIPAAAAGNTLIRAPKTVNEIVAGAMVDVVISKRCL